jgi:hypothetical protein
VTVDIPESALSFTAQMTVKPVPVSQVPAVPLGAVVTRALEIRLFDHQGQSISRPTTLRPVTIRVAYTDDDLRTAGGDETRLKIGHYDEVEKVWQLLPTIADTKGKILTATVQSFSLFSVQVTGAQNAGLTDVIAMYSSWMDAQGVIARYVKSPSCLTSESIGLRGEGGLGYLMVKRSLVDDDIRASDPENLILDASGRVVALRYVTATRDPAHLAVAIALESADSPSRTGVALLTAFGAGAKVRIDIDPDPDAPDTVLAAQIRVGTPDNPGRILSALSNIVRGRSETVVDVSLRELLSGNYSVHLRAPGRATSVWSAAIPHRQDVLTVQLETQPGSPPAGFATFTSAGEQTEVVLSLDPSVSGGPGARPAHIHAAGPEQREKVVYDLAPVANGRSASVISTPLRELIDQEYVIDVHNAGQAELSPTLQAAISDDAIRPSLYGERFHDGIMYRGVAEPYYQLVVWLGDDRVTRFADWNPSVVCPAGVQPRPVIPGDIDDNQVVDARDAALLALAFGARRLDPGFIKGADVNRDGVIDGKDVAILAANFGQGR